MHEKFANWYQPLTFGHNRETIELRWKGVEKVADETTNEELPELIKLVFGSSQVSSDFLVNFRKSFKDIDPTFLSEGNDHEVLVLAGCVLAVLCLDYEYPEVAPLILTASLSRNRKLLVDFDLIGMAEEKIRIDGAHNRERPKMSKPVKNVPAKSINPETSETLKETTVKALNNMQENIHNEILKLQKTIRIQDEELQLLWWMVGGRSVMWDRSFVDIDKKSLPILLAIEAASMTNELIEAPSLKAVFSRVGITDKNKVSIPEAFGACGEEVLQKIKPAGKICSTTFPLHFAAVRALETRLDPSWIAGWAKISNIKEDAELTHQDLALQIYRESKLMQKLTTSD